VSCDSCNIMRLEGCIILRKMTRIKENHQKFDSRARLLQELILHATVNITGI
jgi:hypothetical protein